MASISEIGPGAAAESVQERLTGILRDRSEAGRARRFAAGAFAARVLNAGLGFATQILLARWMGERDYGIYASVWVWVLVAGGVLSLGLPVAALKLVPDYRERGDGAHLRGFLSCSRLLGPLPGILFSLGGAATILALQERLGPFGAVALVALVALPLYVLTDIQTGIARAFDFADLGLAADYLARPVLLLVLAAALHLAGEPGTAANVMAATLAAVALTALSQGVVLQGRIARDVPAVPRRFDLRRWAELSWPLLTVTGFTLLLGAVDILILPLYVAPEQVAVYFAATKIVAVASFVSYGVSNTSAHRFAAHLARGDRAGLQQLAAQTVRWTFWPTLAVAVVLVVGAVPLLRLFGPGFAGGAPVVAILAAGLVLAAAVGPADRALAMGDHGRATASIYGVAVLANAGFCLALVPMFGLAGAAFGTTLAAALRAALLFVAARRRLGLRMSILPLAGAPARHPTATDADGDVTAELLDATEAARIVPAWRELAGRALEPNVFYGPAPTLAALAHLPEGHGGRVLVAWRGRGDARRLVGVLPLVRARGRHANPAWTRRAGAHYGTLSTPLVDPDRPELTLAPMLSALGRAGIGSVLLPFLHDGGPVTLALRATTALSGQPVLRFEGHRRALLRSPLQGEAYLRATFDGRRRKEFDRKRRRLAEQGSVRFEVATTPAEVGAALEAFLQLEAAGWKGRAGTAMLQAPGAAAFIRAVAEDGARAGTFRVGLMTVDGRPIAAGLLSLAGGRAFYLKTAYDETLATLSPGFLLTLDLTTHLLADTTVESCDSIAVADHPMIDRLWTERFAVESVLVATRPGGGWRFRLAAALERMREAGIAWVKHRRAKSATSRPPSANADGKKDAEPARS